MRHIRLGPGAEFDLIRRFLGNAATEPAVPGFLQVGPGDDCAVIDAGPLALSVDMSIEGVHFQRDWLEPDEIGYRAAAAALSDLAAMAATPAGILVALATRAEDALELAPLLMDGVRAAAAGQGAALIGGDSTRSPGPIIIDAVVIGTAANPILRSGARPGDGVWVTGALGAAAAAVHAWRNGRTPEPAARLAFARPAPRAAEAAWLAERAPLHALIDISDGLAGDAAHLAAASGVGIVLEAAAIPVHAVLHASRIDDPLRLALSGGEDYELCFAAPDEAVARIAGEFGDRFGVTLTRVGSVTEAKGVAMRGVDGAVAELGHGGYDHFAGAG